MVTHTNNYEKLSADSRASLDLLCRATSSSIMETSIAIARVEPHVPRPNILMLVASATLHASIRMMFMAMSTSMCSRRKITLELITECSTTLVERLFKDISDNPEEEKSQGSPV